MSSLWAGAFRAITFACILLSLVLPIFSQPTTENLSATATVLTRPCFSDVSQAGTFRVDATGGIPPYKYRLGASQTLASDPVMEVGVGDYIVTVIDSSFPPLQYTFPVSLTTIPEIYSTRVVAPSLIFKGTPTGLIQIANIIGDAPFTVSMSGATTIAPQQSSQNEIYVGPLFMGSHTLRMVDANGCATTIPVYVPSQLGGRNFPDLTPSCPGVPSGTIAGMYATEGTSPYFYRLTAYTGPSTLPRPVSPWFGPTTSNHSFYGVPPGDWIVEIRDSSDQFADFGRSQQFLTPVQNLASLPAIDITLTEVSEDSGVSNGEFSLTVNGGPYEFSLNGDAYSPSVILSGLAAGNYYLLTRDSIGCLRNDTFVVSPTFTASISATVPTCSDLGRVRLSVSGGLLPYQFRWNTQLEAGVNLPWQDGPLFTGLPVGTHEFLVRDARMKVLSINATVAFQNQGVNISSVTATRPSFPGLSDGSLKVNIINGTDPMGYSINGGVKQSNATFARLAPGPYIVRAEDSFGCTSQTIAVIEPSISIGARATLPACETISPSNGQIVVIVSDGVAPFNVTYGFRNFLSLSSTITLDFLLPGTHAVYITDGALQSRNFTLDVPGYMPSIDAISIQPWKLENGATVVVSHSLLSPEFQYDSSGVWVNNNTFTFTSAGTHEVTIRDNRGCPRNYTIQIPTLLTLSVSSSPQADLFDELTQYDVSLTPAGGSGPFQYLLEREGHNQWVDNPDFVGIKPGAAVFFVRDLDRTVPQIARAEILLEPVRNPSPPSILSITASVDGHVTAGVVEYPSSAGVYPYVFSLDDVTVASPEFSGVQPGLHKLTVVDRFGSRAERDVFVPFRLSIGLASQPTATCFAASTGTVEIQVISGGIAPFFYDVDGTGVQSSSTFPSLRAGSHVATVYDSGNPQQTASLEFTTPSFEKVVTSITVVPASSSPLANGTFTILSHPSHAPVEISYPIFPVIYRLSANSFAVEAGFYSVVALSPSTGCQDAVSVEVNSVLRAQFIPDVPCIGALSTVSYTIEGGKPPYTISVDGSSFDPALGTFITAAGTHSVSIRDSGDYVQEFSTTVNVVENSPLLVSSLLVNASASASVGTATGSINITVSKPQYSGSFSFSLLDGQNSVISGPSASGIFAALIPGNYVVQVEDSRGCPTRIPTIIDLKNFEVVNIDNARCHGENSGNVTFFVSPDFVSPISISRVGFSEVSTSNTFHGLPAGEHTFQISDSSNPPQIRYATATVSQPSALNVQWFASAGTAPRIYDGRLSVSATGGSAPITYTARVGQLDAIIQSTPVDVAIDQSDIYWRVADSNGCFKEMSFYGAPAVTVAAREQPIPTCRGSNTGSFVVAAEGGNAPYTFEISGPTVTNRNVVGNVASYSSLGEGLYLVTVTDSSSGAPRQAQVTVSIPTEDISLSSDMTVLGSVGTAAYVSLAVSGLPGERYEFNVSTSAGDSHFNTTQSELWLSAGSYDILAYSSRSKCKSSMLSLSLPNKLEASIDPSSSRGPSCAGTSDGVVKVSVIGGIAPFSYYLNGAHSYSPEFTGLPAGVYSVRVSDSGNPPQTVSVPSITFEDPAAIVAYAETRFENRLIPYASMVLTISAGPWPWTITANGRPARIGWNNNLSGRQDIVVTNAVGCSVSFSTLIKTFQVVAEVAESTQPICCGETGSFTLKAQEGWEYRIVGQPFGPFPNFTGLAPGSYAYEVREITDPATIAYGSSNFIVSEPACPSIRFVDARRASGADVPALVRVFVDGRWDGLLSFDNGAAVAGTDHYLLPGQHTVKLSTCSQTSASVSFVVLTELTATYVSYPPRCSGKADGSISVVASGGLPPYRYLSSATGSSWTENQMFTNVPAGTRTIEVEDSGATPSRLTLNVVLEDPPILALRLDNLPLATNTSTADATISAVATGGVPPYSYRFSQSSLPVGTFVGVAPGNYTVTVTDVAGCVSSLNVTVSSRVSASATVSNVRCASFYGRLLFDVDVVTRGGSRRFEYLVNGAGGYSAQNTFGSETVQFIEVRDIVTNDVYRASFTNPYVNWNPIQGLATSSPDSGSSNGAVSLTASFGKPPYSFMLGSTTQSSGSFTGLAAGTYSWTITDSYSSCSASGTITVAVTTALRSAGVQSVTPVTCPGGSNGQIQIADASGGTGPYSYRINSSAVPQPSSLFTGLPAGVYEVEITDAASATFLVKDIRVREPLPIIASARYASGGIRVANQLILWLSISGGASPYRVLSGGSSAGTASTPDGYPLWGLTYGNHDLTILDDNLCAASLPVSYWPKHLVSFAVQNAPCRGQLGSFEVLVERGSGNFSYRIQADPESNWESSAVFSNLLAGQYVVEVFDNTTGLTSTGSVTILEPETLTLQVQVSRFGANPVAYGTISFDASGGSRPYSFEIEDQSSGMIVSTSLLTFDRLLGGSFFARVRDGQGCVSSQIPFVPVSKITCDAIVVRPLCSAGTGSATVSASYGTGNYEYAYALQSNNASQNLAWSSSSTFADIQPGVYVFYVRDDLSDGHVAQCIATITAPAPLMVSVASTGASYAASDATAVVTVSGGTEPYLITVGPDVSPSNPLTLINLGLGSYSGSVVDFNGCSKPINFEIFSKISASVSVTNVNCSGASTGVITINAVGGSSYYVYRMIVNDRVEPATSNNVFPLLPAGSYSFLVVDAQNPSNDFVVSASISQPQTSVIPFVLEKRRSSLEGNTGYLSITASGGSAPYFYAISNSSSFQSNGNFSALYPGLYTAFAKDAVGCVASVPVTVLSDIRVEATPTTEGCPGSASSKIEVRAIGGQPPYLYQVDDLEPQLDPVIRTLYPGQHRLVVTDSSSEPLSVSVNVTIEAPPSIAVSFSTILPSYIVNAYASGGYGGPYSFVGGNYIGYDNARQYGLCSGTIVVYDRAGCGANVPIQCVEAVSAVVERVGTRCIGAGPAVTTIRARARNGLAPFSHHASADSFSNDVDFDLPASWNGRAPEFTVLDAFGRHVRSAATFALVPGVYTAIGVQSVVTNSETGMGRSDGSAYFYMRYSLPYTLVLTKNSVEVSRTNVSGSIIISYSLSGGDYTATFLTNFGCQVSTNFTIGTPASPTIANFQCRLDLFGQSIQCIWDYVSLDTRFRVDAAAYVGANDTTTFRTLRDYSSYRPSPPQFEMRYEYGLLYDIRLYARGLGGESSSTVTVAANALRPPAPAAATLSFDSGNAVFSWSQPEDITGSELTYSVILKLTYPTFVDIPLATGVPSRELLIPVADVNSLGIDADYRFSISVISFSVNFGVSSEVPTVAQSPSYVWANAPVVPVPTYSIPYCGGRTCRRVELDLLGGNAMFGGASVSSVFLEVGVRLLDDPSYRFIYASTIQTDRARFAARGLFPPFPFHATVEVLVRVTNLVATSNATMTLVYSEPPQAPNFYPIRSSSTGNSSLQLITMTCEENSYLALGIQSPTYVYEWTWSPNPGTGDWVSSEWSFELAGSFQRIFESDGSTITARCYAVNAAGTTRSSTQDSLQLANPIPKPDFVMRLGLRYDTLAIPNDLSSRQSFIVVNFQFIFPYDSSTTSPTGLELRMIGKDCVDSPQTLIVPSFTYTYSISQLSDCFLTFSYRVLTNRGPSDWSDQESVYVNYVPSTPIATVASIPQPTHGSEVNITVTFESVYPFYDDVRFYIVQMSGNGTRFSNSTVSISNSRNPSNDSGWESVAVIPAQSGTPFPPFTTNRLLFTATVRFLVTPEPRECIFRAIAFNGFRSEPSQNATLIVQGVPRTPLLTAEFQFAALNTSVSFFWLNDELSTVVYDVLLELVFLNGTQSSRRVTTNSTSVTFGGIPAGTIATGTVTGKTAYRVGDSAAASVLIVADYWETNITSLSPVVVQERGLTVDLRWQADMSRHGFQFSQYIVRYSRYVPGNQLEWIEATRITNPVIMPDGSVNCTVSTGSLRNTLVIFSVIPFNPLGTGPPSFPSTPAQIYTPPVPVAVYADSLPPLVNGSATLRLYWNAVPFVTSYSISLAGGDGVQHPTVEAPCCELVYNVSSNVSLATEMAVRSPVYGLSSKRAFVVIPPPVGVPNSVLLRSLRLSRINITSGEVVVSYQIGFLNDLRLGGGFVIEYSVTNSGAWDQLRTSEISSTTISRLTPGLCYDVRVYATNIYGRGPSSNVLTQCVAEFSSRILEPSPLRVDYNYDPYTDVVREGIMTTFSWKADRPIGSDPEEYRLELYLCDMRVNCFYSSIFAYANFNVPPGAVAANQTLSTRLPLKSGTLRITILARNLMGWNVVYNQRLSMTVVPRPFDMRISNPTFSRGRPYGSAKVTWLMVDTEGSRVYSSLYFDKVGWRGIRTERWLLRPSCEPTQYLSIFSCFSEIFYDSVLFFGPDVEIVVYGNSRGRFPTTISQSPDLIPPGILAPRPSWPGADYCGAPPWGRYNPSPDLQPDGSFAGTHFFRGQFLYPDFGIQWTNATLLEERLDDKYGGGTAAYPLPFLDDYMRQSITLYNGVGILATWYGSAGRKNIRFLLEGRACTNATTCTPISTLSPAWYCAIPAPPARLRNATVEPIQERPTGDSTVTWTFHYPTFSGNWPFYGIYMLIYDEYRGTDTARTLAFSDLTVVSSTDGIYRFQMVFPAQRYFYCRYYVMNTGGDLSELRDHLIFTARIPRLLGFVPANAISTIRGGNRFEVVLDPPPRQDIPLPFIRLRLGSQEFGGTYRSWVVPAVPSVGTRQLSWSYDGLFWSNSIPFQQTSEPSNPVVTAPTHLKIRRLETFTMYDPGFTGVTNLDTVLNGIVLRCSFDAAHTTATCPTATVALPVPLPVRIGFIYDGFAYNTSTTIIFWDPDRVSATVSATEISPGCVSSGSSRLQLRISRWPYSTSKNVPITMVHDNPDVADPIDLVMRWNSSTGAFEAPMPAIIPGTYSVFLDDDFDLAPTTFVFSSECDPVRARCLSRGNCFACGQDSSCTWVSPVGGFGLCIRRSDLGVAPANFTRGTWGATDFTSCPNVYFHALRLVQSDLAVSGSNAIVSYTASMLISHGTLSIFGSGTWSCASAIYQPYGTVVGTFSFGPTDGYTISFRCSFLINPALVDLGGSIAIRIVSSASRPRLMNVPIRFRPRADLSWPEGITERPPALVPGIIYSPPATYALRIVNPVFIRRINWYYIRQGTSTEIPAAEMRAPLNSDAPYFGSLVGIALHGTEELSAGRYTLKVVLNEGNLTQIIVTSSFDVYNLPDFIGQIINNVGFLGRSTLPCYSYTVSKRVCFRVNFMPTSSSLFPGQTISTGLYLRLSLILNTNAATSGSVETTPTGGTEGMRLSLDLQLTFFYTGVIDASLFIEGAFTVNSKALGFSALAIAQMDLAPATATSAASITFIEAFAALRVSGSLSPPAYRMTVRKGVVYATLYMGTEIGPTIRVCNSYRSNNCPLPLYGNLKFNLGVIVTVTVSARVGVGFPILFDASVFSEGVLSVWGEGDKPVRGTRVSARMCATYTIFYFYSETTCPYQWYTSYGEPFPDRGRAKRVSPEHVVHRHGLIAPKEWKQRFHGFALPSSAASYRKRSVPVTDEGVFVEDIHDSARPKAVSQLRGPLSMLTWVGYDTTQPVPKGANIVYSVYNSSSGLLSDPAIVRNSSMTDTNPIVSPLPDGRFLLLISTLPDLGAISNYVEANWYRSEIAWTVYNPSSQTWSPVQLLTSDATYGDIVPSTTLYLDQKVGSPTFNKTVVLAAWIRSRNILDDREPQKDIMGSTFDPATNTWTTPSVVVADISLQEPPTLATLNDTVVLMWVDWSHENRSAAYMTYLDTVSGSWSGLTAPFGRAYIFANVSGFGNVTFAPFDPFNMRQSMISAVNNVGRYLVVTWVDDLAVLSRAYTSKTIRDAVSLGVHPPVQLVYQSPEETAPRSAYSVAVYDGGFAGGLLTWVVGSVTGNVYGVSYLLPDRMYWEAPISAQHRASAQVLASTIFSPQADTAFVVFTSQEVGRYSNGTEFLDHVSLEYKRINLLPILSLTSVQLVSRAQTSSSDASLELSFAVSNTGGLPSSSGTVAIMKGTYSSVVDSAAQNVSVPSIRPGLAARLTVPLLSFATLRNGGYAWLKVLDSSAAPVRLSLYSVTVSSLQTSRSADATKLAISASVSASGSFGLQDSFVAVPVAFYTGIFNSTEQKLLTSVLVNCSLSGEASVQFEVLKSNLYGYVNVSAGAQDEIAHPDTEIVSQQIQYDHRPDLSIEDAQVLLLNPFLGTARVAVTVKNLGVAASQAVTVSARLGSAILSNTTVTAVEGLTSVTVELPLPASSFASSGGYNISFSAQSAVNFAALGLYEQAVSGNPNITADGFDLERSYINNQLTTEIHLYSPCRLEIREDALSARISPTGGQSTIYIPISNSAGSASSGAPLSIFASSQDVGMTLLRSLTLPTIAAGSSTVVQVQFSSADSVAPVLNALSLSSSAELVIVIPALYSGSVHQVRVQRSLSAAMSAAVPTPAAVTLEPRLSAPESISIRPGETLTADLVIQNSSPSFGALSIALLGSNSAPGVTFNSASSRLTFSAPMGSPDTTADVDVGIVMQDSSIFERRTIRYQVAGDPVLPAPAIAPVDNSVPSSPPSDITPTEASPASSSVPSGGVLPQTPSDSAAAGSSPAGAIVGGIIVALILLALLVLLVLFIRRRKRGEVPPTTSGAVRAFFMPFSSPKSSKSQEMSAQKPSKPKSSAPIPAAAPAESSDDYESSDLSSESSSTVPPENSTSAENSASDSAASSASPSSSQPSKSSTRSESRDASESSERSEELSESPQESSIESEEETPSNSDSASERSVSSNSELSASSS